MLCRIFYAYTLAGLGDRSAALAEAERALAEMPVSKDAIQGGTVLALAMKLHAMVGETQRALDEPGLSLRLPAGAMAHRVQLDPFLDSLRGEPRYKEMMAEALKSSE